MITKVGLGCRQWGALVRSWDCSLIMLALCSYSKVTTTLKNYADITCKALQTIPSSCLEFPHI